MLYFRYRAPGSPPRASGLQADFNTSPPDETCYQTRGHPAPGTRHPIAGPKIGSPPPVHVHFSRFKPNLRTNMSRSLILIK